MFVRDLAPARRFYEEALGLALAVDLSEHGCCVFRSGAVEIVVETVADDAPEEDRALVGRFTGLSFTVADIAATHRDLGARGVVFTGAPEQQYWGGTVATLRDPAGDEVQIVQRRPADVVRAA